MKTYKEHRKSSPLKKKNVNEKKSGFRNQRNNLKNKVILSGKTCYMHVHLIIGTKTCWDLEWYTLYYPKILGI
jgi:hypothetical protein